MIKKIIFLLFILQGCATAYDEIFVLIKNQTLGYPNQSITLDAFKDAEFSFITFKVGRNPKVKLVLSSVQNDIYEWVSSDMHTIYTYNGLIIKTSGLPHNIFLRDFHSFDPSLFANFNTVLEYDKPTLVGASMALSYESKKDKPDTNIYSNISSYFFLREVESIGWKSKDEYWYSEKSVIYSKQKIHPQMAEIEIEFFYKF